MFYFFISNRRTTVQTKKNAFLRPAVLLFGFYSSDRAFVVRQNSNRSRHFNINAHFSYNASTHGIAKISIRWTRTYADDTIVTVFDEHPTIVSRMIPKHPDIIHLWNKWWKIKIYESRFSYSTFTVWNESCPPGTLNNIAVPVHTQTK